jgi:hypothetical protein
MNDSFAERVMANRFPIDSKKTAMVWATLVLLLLSTAVAVAGPIEIWITPVGAGLGTGTPDDPFSTPDADSFFNLINDQRIISGTNFIIPEYSTIHLMPGTFHVREGHTGAGGARVSITLKEGWKLRGAGMDTTVVQLIPNPQPLQNNIVVISGCAITGNPTANYFDAALMNSEVSDLTVDCNLQNQTQSAECISAISMPGSHNKISRVKAINWGSAVANEEAFVLGVTGHGALPASESLEGIIEDCVVVQPAQVIHACDTIAITACSTPGETRFASWKIRGCLVRDIVSGNSLGQPDGFAAFGAGNDAELSDCTAYNLGGNAEAAYSDTISYHDMVYRNNKFINVANGIFFNGSDYDMTNLSILDNIITSTNSGGVEIWLYNPDYAMRGIRIEGNVIRPNVAGGSMADALSINGNITFSADNNVLDAGSGLDFATSGYNYTTMTVVSFKNNVNLRGDPLTIGEYPDSTWAMKEDYDEQLTFSPASAGWYKILLTGSGKSGARVELWSPQTHLDVGIGYAREIGGTSLGEITMLYNDSDQGDSTISDARLAHYDTLGSDENTKFGPWAGDALEAYFSEAQVGYPVNIRVSGMNRPSLSWYGVCNFAPYQPETTPATTLQLDIGPGIRTTGPIYSGVSGGAVQQITDSSGHIEPAALSMVQPAQGGLGQDASGQPANRFPYTTATGTFGFGMMTAYTLGLLNSPDVETAQNTLQLVPGTQIQPYDSKLTAMASSPVTSTEFGYLSGLSSSIQTQINSKQATLGYTPVNKAGDSMTGALGIPGGSATTPSLYDAPFPGSGLFFLNGVSIATAGIERLRVDGQGAVSLGSSGPNGFFASSSFYGLDICNGAIGLVLGAQQNDVGSPRQDNVDKYARIASAPYSINQWPVTMMFAHNSQFDSELEVGGGAFSIAAATKVEFYTAATTNIPGGSLRWQIDSAGTFAAGSDNTYDIGAPGARPRDLVLGGNITAGNLAASKVLVSDGGQSITNSTVTSTELGYLSGATNGIQNQLNALSASVQQKIYKTADQNIATNAGDVTDLSFPVAANTDYGFEFTVVVTNSSTVKGYQLALNGPSAPTELTAKMEVPSSSGAMSSTGTSYGVDTYGTFVGPTSSGPGTGRVIATICGAFRNGTNAGTFTLQAQSVGTSSTVTVKRGSWGYYWQLN